MDAINLLNAIGYLLYFAAYLFNPAFREEERIRNIEKKKNEEISLKIEKKKRKEEIKRKFHEARLMKISKNEDLIDICLSDPVFCVENNILINQIHLETREKKYKENFESEWKKHFIKLNYGCYCREKPDLTIYQFCPIDNNSLDIACKYRHICLQSKNLNWAEGKECNLDFSSYLNSLPNYIESDSDFMTNEDILYFSAGKYKALLNINNKMN